MYRCGVCLLCPVSCTRRIHPPPQGWENTLLLSTSGARVSPTPIMRIFHFVSPISSYKDLINATSTSQITTEGFSDKPEDFFAGFGMCFVMAFQPLQHLLHLFADEMLHLSLGSDYFSLFFSCCIGFSISLLQL